MRKRIAAVAVAAALALASVLGLSACGQGGQQAGSGQQHSEKVVVGTLATEDILPMWVAEDAGLFEKAGVDASIQTFQSATELIAAVNAGEVQMAMTDPMVTASIYASGTDVQIEWVTLGTTAEQGRFGIMTADPEVKSLADLAGIEVGVGSNTILEYVLDRLMERAGVPADQVLTAELQKLPVRYQACVSGQVAAAALPASLLALGEASGCTVVADDTTGDNISQSVMIAASSFAASDAGAAALEALKGVWDEAAASINADPESYRALLAEKANLSDQIADTYSVSEYPSCQLPAQEQVDDILAWMKAKGYLAEGISYDAATGCFSGR
ncbi:MAG: ABC transporter substrate-binding protein [Coriobacteriaceae bacterium]|nr:ABC transporter substrate-binding protein [Coriobacteriaceae bacterium]